MATPRFLSPYNGYIPAATGQAIAFVRDPKKFKLNEYAQLIKSPKPVGIYSYLDPDYGTRVVTDEEFAWEDGDRRPQNNHNLASFKFESFRCKRRNYGFTLGYEAIENAEGSFDPKMFHQAGILTQAMTNKTSRVIKMLENPTNWGNNHATADVLNGGFGGWDLAAADPSSPYYLAIRKTLNEAVRRIVLMTNGMVTINDLRLVISPGLAKTMSETDEINAFLKNNQFGLGQVTGGVANQNENYGLPPRYANLPIIVEDAVIVTSRPKASGAPAVMDVDRTFIKSDDSAIICSRVGGLDGNYGSPSFSTVQLYFHKYELTVEGFDDPENKRYNGNVVDHYHEVLAAAPAGYLIEGCK
ncbi:hypothetical protein [Tuwongella immobilis]|uniref:Uncharacterized protein n=1 Tax=Tuwongella immobilis TaxID=692036 RepID=A0A6C2YXS4_9BACT|nr:hypothetical protein [Tuwongella immobilis]VIP05602.1 unnamed protein product [Tuwongella immobilis]VTS08559.1 unnamed protein product [Tuwongella immobilis]